MEAVVSSLSSKVSIMAKSRQVLSTSMEFWVLLVLLVLIVEVEMVSSDLGIMRESEYEHVCVLS